LRNALQASSKNKPLLQTLVDLPAADVAFLSADWQLWARDDQLPPAHSYSGDPWRVWLIMGGRGAGKTRAGAEWIRAKALGLAPIATEPGKFKPCEPSRRIALVGETLGDVRHVMIEGISGLLAIHSDAERPVYEPSKGQLTWPNGAIAQMFGGDNAESLRGPQFDTAWVDELAKWREPEHGWDMLQFSLRLGSHPQMVVTTTPRPLPLLKKLLEDPTTVVTRSKTADNASNLAPSFISEISRRYAGTALARQELDGEIVDTRAGALWRRDWINAHRIAAIPDLKSIVVAVDPPVTATASSDACGIMVVGIGEDNRAYVISDRTVQGREPHVWARAAVSAYKEFMADRIVAEVNQGGDLVVSVLRQIDPGVAVQKVRATRGKWLRAEPVAALYAEGRVSHVGTFPQLEDQMCAFGADGLASGRSPDRLDALVWALTSLLLGSSRDPTIRPL
jgi:phage terminase large subunit-like protein